jgi:hypothetical protein
MRVVFLFEKMTYRALSKTFVLYLSFFGVFVTSEVSSFEGFLNVSETCFLASLTTYEQEE